MSQLSKCSISSVPKNTTLLVAIRERNLTQRSLAQLVGIHETLISLVVNGRYRLDSMQQKKVAAVLGKTPKELFPK